MRAATVLSLAAGVTSVLGCGFTTHNLVAHRAVEAYFTPRVEKYKGIVETHKNAALAGAPFPDYLYQCGDDGDAGEDTHWSPWQAAAANYIRKLPQPWDEDAERLVAFLFGVTAHYIGDMTWHGLAQSPSGYGFIQSLGHQNYNCTGNLCSVAHSKADTGGEFVASYATDLEWFEPGDWYVPTEHLLGIYREFGRPEVTRASIEECQLIFYAGAMAIKYLADIIFIQQTAEAPFLVEEYLWFPFGGVDDQAVWTARMFDRLVDWIEEGPPDEVPPLFKKEQELHEASARLRRHNSQTRIHMLRALAPLTLAGGNPAAKTAADGGEFLDFSALKPLSEQRGVSSRAVALLEAYAMSLQAKSALKGDEQKQELESVAARLRAFGARLAALEEQAEAEPLPAEHRKTPSQQQKPFAANAGTSEFEYYGSAVALGDFNGDGIQDVATGAFGKSFPGNPQGGQVTIEYGGGNTMDVVLTGNATYGRFGYSLAALDLNLDGVDDLVVGAPQEGYDWSAIPLVPEFRNRGAVHVFFGQLSQPLPSAPDYSIMNSEVNMMNFGTTLAVGDINNDDRPDLLVGSPQARGGDQNGISRGMVHGFNSTTTRRAGESIGIERADLTLAGPTQFGHFGQAMQVAETAGQGKVLVVGAPGYRRSVSGGTNTVGRLYGYSLSTPPRADTPLWTVDGRQENAKLGHSLAFSGTQLAAGLPSFTAGPLLQEGAGQVVVFPIDTLRGEYDVDGLPATTAQLTCSVFGARFGWDVQWVGGGSVLVASAPFYTDGLDGAHHAGAVFAYKEPRGTVANAEGASDWNVVSTEPGRLGANLAADAMTVPAQIVAGAPLRFNGGVDMAGATVRYVIQ